MKPYDDQRTKGDQVEAMFDGIAPTYDRLNDIMSLGIAHRWRRAVVRAVKKSGARQIMDLATGTGDLAIAMSRRLPHAHITGVDFSDGMLALARKKAPHNIDFIRAAAESLPFDEGEFDAVTVAFGVRNFYDIARGLGEIYRVLRPGGTVSVLEFSTPRNRIFGAIYKIYFHHILPRIGALLSKDRRAYDYLPNSVAEFSTPAQFVGMLGEAGFSDCRARALTGGVAYIYKGTK